MRTQEEKKKSAARFLAEEILLNEHVTVALPNPDRIVQLDDGKTVINGETLNLGEFRATLKQSSKSYTGMIELF